MTANKFGASFEVPSIHAQYTDISNDYNGNVYTIYFSYYPDYGLVGVCVVMIILGALLTTLVLFYQYGLPPVLARAIGWPFGARVGLAVALLAPLGLCLGAFLPLGMRTAAALTPHRSAIVAWGWAVNAFAAVVSSVLSTILSMTFGFNAVMLAALGVYLLGIAALRGIAE